MGGGFSVRIMSNVSALVMFVALIAGWAFGWRTVSNRVVQSYGWKPVFGHLVGLVAGFLPALGMLCIVGAFFDNKEALSIQITMAIFGLLLLAPFVHFWRKWRTVAATPSSATLNRVTGANPPVKSTAPQQRSHDAIAPITYPASVPHAPAHMQGATLPCTFMFSYRAQDGNHSPRTVNVTNISINGGHAYLEGFCHDRMDHRTFRTDRIIGDLTDTETGELLPVARLLSSVRSRSKMDFRPPTTAPALAPKKYSPKEWQTAVLFTGFAAGRRDELETLAESSGWDVRSTVGSTLDYLVTGPRAGPSKIAKAQELGVCMIDEDTFLAMVE